MHIRRWLVGVAVLHVLPCIYVTPAQVQAGQVRLCWEDPNNPAVVGGYTLYYWQSTWDTSASVDVGQQTTYTLAGLENGKTYYVTVTAYGQDEAGESPHSEELMVTVSPDSSAPPSPSRPPPSSSTAGLVAAYNFEELSGSTVTDVSGNGNHGTLAGARRTNAGKFGKALRFDGHNDWVTVPDDASLDLTTGMTLQAWIYPTVTPDGWRTVIGKEQSDGEVYYLYASSDTHIPASGIYIQGEREWYMKGGTRVARNTWTHLAATYDGHTHRLYVNGTEVVNRSQKGHIRQSAGVLRLGGNSVWGEYYAGRIDEVRIYNRALTAGEIRDSMHTPIDLSTTALTAAAGLIRIEAEAMRLTGYNIQSSADASAGGLINRPRAADASPGRAKVGFPGPAGLYEVIVTYFDENDGQSTLEATINGRVVDKWVAHEDMPEKSANAVTLTYRVIAQSIALARGDIITLVGWADRGERATLDCIEFIPVNK